MRSLDGCPTKTDDNKGKEGRNKKGDKPLDTGYPALIPVLPTGKGGKNPEKVQPPALDAPFPLGNRGGTKRKENGKIANKHIEREKA